MGGAAEQAEGKSAQLDSQSQGQSQSLEVDESVVVRSVRVERPRHQSRTRTEYVLTCICDTCCKGAQWVSFMRGYGLC